MKPPEYLAEIVRDAEDRLVETGLGLEVSVKGSGDRVLTYRKHGHSRTKKMWTLLYGPVGYQRPLAELDDQTELEAGIALIPALETHLVNEAQKKAAEINEVVDRAQETIRKARESRRKHDT